MTASVPFAPGHQGCDPCLFPGAGAQLVNRGIRGKAVALGPVWAPRIPAERPAKEVEKVGVTTCLDRPAQPEEISPADVFLAAPCCSSYITGIVQPITGNAGDGA